MNKWLGKHPLSTVLLGMCIGVVLYMVAYKVGLVEW